MLAENKKVKEIYILPFIIQKDIYDLLDVVQPVSRKQTNKITEMKTNLEKA